MLSVIIPIYNEKDTLIGILEKVKSVPIEKEIIIVDDGSEDGTRDLLNSFKSEKGMKIVFQEKNKGKGSAIQTGLQYVMGEVIIIQDADLEYNPQDYMKLVPPVESGKADVVYGSRILGNNKRSYDRYYWGGRLVTFFANLLYGLNLTDAYTCYKVFKKEILDSIHLSSKGFEFCAEVTAKVSRLGYRIVEVPISYHPRSFKEGKKIKWKDGVIALWTLSRYRFLSMRKILKSNNSR